MGNQQLQHFIDYVDRGIQLYWRTLGKARNMRIYSGDIDWAISDDRSGPERIFSIRLSPENAEQRVQEIAEGIKTNVLPNGILITPKSKPSNIDEMLEAKGFEIDASSPGMVLDLSEFKCSQPSDEKIRVAKVEDPESLRMWVDIVNLDFHIMSYEQFHDLYCLPEVSLYLSFYNNTEAGTFMIIREGSFTTLEMVNTLKEYQRKGIAEAALNSIFYDLRAEGVGIVTLRSSTEGIRLYTKLGFKEYCKRVLATYGQEN